MHILLLISSLPYRKSQRHSVAENLSISNRHDKSAMLHVRYIAQTLRISQESRNVAPSNHGRSIYENGRHADLTRMPSVISASQYRRVRCLPYV
ncbi:hypothetical protein BIFPSEUDO_02429 [Bifidobacterium pseudocatenulatum DSM 20438 = JCM 1200 = LMG 10505]|uniref:Uncharacterized protein n=1 Tax=Bifidobacterium pseudocatenulatum DSM 20438 = JCM 1200 = LMG 10505 TaxID=547043 RepID=C0BPZ1_BIFPS|nr:hypothetical protein BIFPSEUDO_02429 [Bifidobacterium pseudocatenulatum DSM 20438 = JCM 1200 = LMG 10505]